VIPAGDIEGKMTVTRTGPEASQRRVDQVLEDDTARKKFLEEEIREAILAACEVERTNQPDRKASSPTGGGIHGKRSRLGVGSRAPSSKRPRHNARPLDALFSMGTTGGQHQTL
jgi:hypothetical protein